MTDPNDVANMAIKHFANQFRKHNHKFDNLPKEWGEEYKPLTDVWESFYLLLKDNIDIKECLATLKLTKNKSAPGLSDISYKLIKKKPPDLHDLLILLNNFCIIPNQWKITSLYPILKPYDWDYSIASTHPIILIECTRNDYQNSEEQDEPNYKQT